MLKLFIKHEIMSLLKTNRVIWSMVLFLVLFSLFFSIRAEDYQKRMNVYIQDVEQTKHEMDRATNYSFLNPRAIRKPLLFSIYHEGNTHSNGNTIDIKFFNEIIYSQDLNAQNNQFFYDLTQLDITYLVTFFLSLFILLISYDCINREKKNGTLRIIMTWPFKRNLYLIKKITGITCFVFLVFFIPYFLSLIYLIITYSDMLTSGFILSYLAYLFIITLYILLMSSIGVLVSILSKTPARSLVIALFIWVFITIITPMLWSFAYNFSPKSKSDLIQTKLYDATNQYISFFSTVPDSINPDMTGHWMWSGGSRNSYTTFGEARMMKIHREYNRYLVEKFMPLLKKREELYSQLGISGREFNALKPYILFFNPNICLQYAASNLGGSSNEDYQQFIQDARDIRDKLMDQGIRDGWLYSNEYFASYDPNVTGDDLMKMGLDLNNVRSWEEVFNFIEKNVKPFDFKVPEMAVYQQRDMNFTQILARIWTYILLMVFMIIMTMYALKYCFDRYDVR